MEQGRGNIIGGIILVAIGLAFLAMQAFGDAAGSFILLGLGIAFLAVHSIYGSYGFLVPGGVLMGIGAGLIAEEFLNVGGEPVVLGLGIGFCLIWAVDRGITHKGPDAGAWWPLIPGTILTLIGLGSLVPDLTRTVLQYAWPIAIIAVGLLVIWRGVRDRKRG